jgi:hypothetical protein
VTAIEAGGTADHAQPMRLNPKPIWQTGLIIAAAAAAAVAAVLIAVELAVAIVAIRYFAETLVGPPRALTCPAHGASDRGSPGASATLDQCTHWSPG